jgi:flap endonuclease-1
MGIDLSGIVTSQNRKLEDFKGKIMAVDAFNTLYQFLSIIRQPDGTPLKDSQGRVTSHLAGLIYRNANLLEAGIKPVYVFDGKPHLLKARTVEERIRVRKKAKEEWEEALAVGDIERARTKAQASSRLTEEMVGGSKALLDKLGIPYVQAPGEGEAQASAMARTGAVWGTASQDYDSLLFGCPILVRNLTVTGRRKLPRKQMYVEVVPEQIDLAFNLKELGVTREQLVDIAIMVGTDFNDGVRGIGPKKALGLVRTHGSLEEVIREKNFEVEDYEEVRRIFLEPAVTEEFELAWREPDEGAVVDFLCGEFEFSQERVKKVLEKVRESRSSREQSTLEKWF